MSLNWSWKDKIGNATLVSRGKEYDISLYDGNAYLIELYEYTEDDKDMYQLQGFFADKEHAQRCLGIKKGYETYGHNMYETEDYKWTKIRLNKKYRHLKELTGMLVQAFNNITIEVYEDGE